MPPASIVRGLVRRSLPRGERESLIVLRAYLDASGKQSDRVVIVAGCVAWLRTWEKFEARWQEFLDEFKLDRFHCTNFWARRGKPYERWSLTEWEYARDSVGKIISATPAICVSIALDTTIFDEWRNSLDYYFPADPYYFCLDSILYQLIYRMKEGPVDDGITIYCDQEKEHELLGTDIARWHGARLANDPHLASFPFDGPRAVSVLYGPNRKFLPLQLADIYSHGMFQKVSQYLSNGSINDPFFLQCMNKNGPDNRIDYLYNTIERLRGDSEYRKRRQQPPTLTSGPEGARPLSLNEPPSEQSS